MDLALNLVFGALVIALLGAIGRWFYVHFAEMKIPQEGAKKKSGFPKNVIHNGKLYRYDKSQGVFICGCEILNSLNVYNYLTPDEAQALEKETEGIVNVNLDKNFYYAEYSEAGLDDED